MLEELLVLEELLDEGKELEVVLLLVEVDEGSVLLLVVEAVVPVMGFEEGAELVKVGILVVTLPVGVMVLPL